MKLATERGCGSDGRLVLVSRDQSTIVVASEIAATLQDALDRWDDVAPRLQTLSDALNAGRAKGAEPFAPERMAAPLPRAWQWLDGSAYPTHGELMQKAFSLPPIPTYPPLMYQGMSHQLLGPHDPVPLPSEADGIDFEGEIGIITGDVPMGRGPEDALGDIRLIVQLNDWSLRAIAPSEMKTGFGWIQAKPACSMAPIAVTPDELGDAWSDGRIDARLDVWLNGEPFGSVPTSDMQFGFHELIAHAAATRNLCAGTIIGSGTVSSPHYARAGSCCLAERRAIETIETGAPRTSFMKFGDSVKMEAIVAGERPFGVIMQRVAAAAA